jgi:hypothetical protein
LADIKAKDPVRRFIDEFASGTQRQVLASTATYTLVTTANQGGKTTVAVVDCAAVLRGIHPHKPSFGPISVLIIVPSRAQAAGIWGKRLLDRSDIRQQVTLPSGKLFDLAQVPLIPANEIDKIVWAYSPQGKYPGYCKLKNGSEFRIALSGDSGSWERVQGFTYDAVYRDEAVGNENLGDELLLRLSAAQTAVQKGTRPWGGSIMWVATATLLNDEFEAYKDRCHKGLPGHQLFWINPNENPAVSMEVRESMRGSMSEHAAAVRLDGTAGAVDDVVIFRHQLSRERHVLKESYVPTPQDNIWVGWDPGWDHPFGLLFCAVSPENPLQLRVWRAVNGRKVTLDQIANTIAMTLDGRMAEAFVFDPAAKKTEHSRGESVAYQMEKMLEQMGVRSYRGTLYGRNRYEDTLPLMSRYLDPDPGNKTAEPLIVMNPDEPWEDQATNGCGQVFEQLSKYRKKQTITGASNRGHNIHKHDDEFVDLLRYIASRQPAWAHREPNIRKTAPFLRAAGPKVQAAPRKHDPLAITPDMDEATRVHRLRLQESSRSLEKFVDGGMNMMPMGRLGW